MGLGMVQERSEQKKGEQGPVGGGSFPQQGVGGIWLRRGR